MVNSDKCKTTFKVLGSFSVTSARLSCIAEVVLFASGTSSSSPAAAIDGQVCSSYLVYLV